MTEDSRSQQTASFDPFDADEEDEAVSWLEANQDVLDSTMATLRNWARLHLSVPLPHTTQSLCPHAAHALEVARYYVAANLSDVSDIKAYSDLGPNTCAIIVVPLGAFYPHDHVASFIEHENANHFGHHLMAFHPDDPFTSLLPGSEDLDDHLIILMTTLSQIVGAGEAMAKAGYYSLHGTQSLRAHTARKEQLAHWRSVMATPTEAPQ